VAPLHHREAFQTFDVRAAIAQSSSLQMFLATCGLHVAKFCVDGQLAAGVIKKITKDQPEIHDV